jgi:hypothetical protein
MSTVLKLLFLCTLGLEKKILQSTGDWHAPMVIGKFRAAVKYLHRLYTYLRGDYIAACEYCISANANFEDVGLYGACPLYAGRPALMETGNPVLAVPFTDEVGIAADALQEHVTLGAISLFPMDIRDLRRVLVGSDIHGYQIYVMILLSIKLFLRAEELLGLRVEHFEPSITIVNQEEVRAIALYVRGKADRVKSTYIFGRTINVRSFAPFVTFLCTWHLQGYVQAYCSRILLDASLQISVLHLSGSTHSGVYD